MSLPSQPMIPVAVFAPDAGVRRTSFADGVATAVADLPVTVAGDGGVVTVDIGAAVASGSVVPVSMGVAWSGSSALSMTFDLAGLGIAPVAGLWSRVQLVGCDAGCVDPVPMATTRDLQAGLLTAELQADVVEGRRLVFVAEADSQAGSYSATPLNVVSDYQVGLSTGSVETGHNFGLLAVSCGGRFRLWDI